MAERRTFVIVGGGLAGAKAAETLRAEGFDGRLLLVGTEPQLPYERPPLSKSYLTGDSPFADARVHCEDFYAEQQVELLAGRSATALDPGARRLELDDGTEVRYDGLLIATGAIPRRPPIDGADDPAALVLRTVADADALKEVLRPGARLVIVGAGWLGCEVAASARTRGAEVTVLEQVGSPLERVLGPELGAYFASVHRAHGVELLMGTGVAGIEAGPRVRLADGRALECDAVLLAVGVAPATELAVAAGLEVQNGIVCDERLTTSAPGVFAAGDVASAHHPRYGRQVRVEHWANALEQGAAAARAMLGAPEPYATLPFFFSDQYDVGLEYTGLHGPEDRLVVRGEPDDGSFQAYWVGADDRLTAGMHVNDWDASEPMQELVRRAARVDADRLRDPGVALDEAARDDARAG